MVEKTFHDLLTTPLTLITDFGLRDHYAGVLKGVLLKHCPSLQFFDLSHNIQPFDIVQAAYVLKNSYAHFPEKTIHLIWVNNEPVEPLPFIAAAHEGHYFFLPDNGLLSLVFREKPSGVVLLPEPEKGLYAQMASLGAAVKLLAEQGDLASLGVPAQEWKERVGVRPVLFRHQIRGTVIYIDRFGNAITNILREDFYRVGEDRPFALYFKRHDPILRLSRSYSDVAIGAPLCLFNADGYLEIAVHMGDAAELLGLSLDDSVQIDFSQL